MPTLSPSYKAGETLYPRRFVTLDTAADKTVNMSIADDEAIGVTYEGSRDAPIPEVTTPIAAAEGGSVRVHGLGETCKIQASAAVASNAYLKPDADGKAVTAEDAGDAYSARAIRSADAEDEDVWAIVERGVVPS